MYSKSKVHEQSKVHKPHLVSFHSFLDHLLTSGWSPTNIIAVVYERSLCNDNKVSTLEMICKWSCLCKDRSQSQVRGLLHLRFVYKLLKMLRKRQLSATLVLVFNVLVDKSISDITQ